MNEPINLIAVLQEILDTEAERLEGFGETSAEPAEDEWPGAVEESAGAGKGHPDQICLYEHLQGLLPEPQNREAAVHVGSCAKCRALLERLQECIETAKGIDVALPPKRAAAPGDVIRTTTRDKVFELTIRPNVKDSSRGVLIVRTTRPELEGKRVVVRDAKRHDLLRGRIVGGEASERVESIGRIDLGNVIIVAL